MTRERRETRTASAKLQEHKRARQEGKRKRNELGVRAAEDVHHLCLRVDVFSGGFGETVEDEFGDVDAPGVQLRLDELGEGEEQDEGASEGGDVEHLVAVGHRRVAEVRPLRRVKSRERACYVPEGAWRSGRARPGSAETSERCARLRTTDYE